VLQGALVGATLAGLVAILTFFLQQRLPYRKMLITTGVLLGVVLLVMVGEQAQEMQLAHWITTTPVPWLTNVVPGWMNLWFSLFPTYETLIAQAIAAVLVIGSYYAARRLGGGAPAEPEPVEEVRVESGAAIPALSGAERY
jgi:high-affinity iron transporter